MKKVRLSVCFYVTVEVDNYSYKSRRMQVEEAIEAIEYSLPYRIDDDDFLDCRFTGVRNVDCEELT